MKSPNSFFGAVLVTLNIIFLLLTSPAAAILRFNEPVPSPASSIGNDTIYSSQTICFNTIPAALTGTIPTGGLGPYTYKWLTSTTSATAGFAIIPGAISQGYAPAALTATRWYRRIVTSLLVSDTTAPIQISVTPVINHASNSVTGTQTICYNTAPSILTGSVPTGGNGAFSYAWQSSPDNTTWTTIAGAAGINDTVAALTATTYFRRITSSGNCSDITASIKITVSPIISNNTIGNFQSVCAGQAPLALTGSVPAGGSGAYTYQWQSSIYSYTAGYTSIGGATAQGYSPGSLPQTTYFRRIVNSGGCSDTSAYLEVTAFMSAPGDPTVFGNNAWNVYAYSDNSFTTYAGYYIDGNLSINTTGRYTTTQSPSSAVGYQGCLVQPTNFSASFKRTNFTPGDYQLDLTAVDDNMALLINGVQVYSKTCCTTPPATVYNIWTGYLGPTDQVEVRWTQFSGPSQLGVNFTAVTPAPLVPGTVGNNQSVCYGDTPPAGFVSSTGPASGCYITGYQWQSSVDSVTWNPIAGATALTYTVSYAMTQTTWYRRVTTDACNNSAATSPVKITVNVIAPGDPTVFGNNVWNAYAYDYPAGNTNLSAATYKGYYIEPSLSFNSTSRWPSGGSPSVASGYQGCYVTPTYNWMVYKRTNFTPAIYQIDIPAHDDWCYLYINGVLIFQHLACCDSHTNVWTGPLGASDQVEFRVMQIAGGSYGALQFTVVTPSPLVAAIITPSQTTCAGSVPPYPMAQSSPPSGGCFITGYEWQSSTDGVNWTAISGATASSYSITNSVYTQTLYRQIAIDACGDSATSLPDTVYMNNSAPGNPSVYGNNTWNVYCFQDVNYSIYAGYYTEPNLTFNTTNRYPSTSPPSTASGYQGCQLVNTYYSTSMKRTGFTAGTYQIDVTADDDFTSVYIDGVLVSSLQYPVIQNNIWTGPLGPTDQIEVRWRNNAGPGQTGLRFTLVTPTTLLPGSITAYNPNLCTGDIPIVNNSTLASGGCFTNYFWQSSTDGGTTWTTISGASGSTDTSYTAAVSPTVPTQLRRGAADICNDTAYSNAVTFTPGAGAVGSPSVYGNGQWNVYCYNANTNAFSSAVYMGYYTEPLLSFNSANRWNANNAPPSAASGYQGCQVDQVNDWVSYQRTNFPPATYQLDIPDHDDDVYLYINGVLVFSQTGCCVSNTDVWTGTLGATDKVQFLWRQYYGASQGALTLTPATAATSVVAGSIGSGQTICSNTSPAAFLSTTAASSTCFVYYQWQSQVNCSGAWSNISGATSLTYAAGILTTPTCFRRMVTDACGNVAYSNTVTVSIYSTTLTPGTIAGSQTICSGSTPAAITATSAPTGGDGNYLYQWQSSPDGVAWSGIAGATSASYSPGPLTATTWYQRTVTACGGSSAATSAAVTITVNQSTVITDQPANAVACPGANTSISVTATGSGLTYQWQVNAGSTWTNVANGAVYGGANTTTLAITGATLTMNGYQYRVIISGACTASATSNTVTLTIGASPAISLQPANTTTCVGSTAAVSLTASGSGLTYQWQQKIGSGAFTSLSDGGIYSGSQTATLTLTGVAATMNGYSYQCIVHSSCGGMTTSVVATLTVVAAISNTITANQSVCTGLNAANVTGPASGSYAYQWQTSTVSATAGFVNASGTSTNYYYTPNPVAVTTYYRRLVTNPGCSSTSNALSIVINPTPLSISLQPANQAICAGNNAVFSVIAGGPGSLTYQWYQYNGTSWSPLSDGGIYSGSATASLTITGATAAMNNYRYYVNIIASGCSASAINSNTAILTTSNAPVITATGPNTTACSGTNTTLSVTATGIGLSYQWQLNSGSGWNNLSNFDPYTNVTTNALTITPVSTSMSGYQYRCIVTGTCAPTTAASAAITLTVNPALANNSVSSSQNLCAGAPDPFTVTTPTGGDGAYMYQWMQNTGSGFVNITGATASNYAPGSLSQTTQYIRTVSDAGCANNNSIAVTITINPATAITANPTTVAVCAGTSTTFSVVASGTGLSYQWQVNPASGTFSNISNGSQYTGATSATLTVVAPGYALNGYQYRCVASGNCGPASAISTIATLTINPVAIVVTQPANVSSCQASAVSFSVGATGSGINYQWEQKIGSGAFSPIANGGIYGGAQTATLVLTGISTAMNTDEFLCVLTEGSCPVNTDSASLTVNSQPTLVITNPSAVCVPSTVDITAAYITAGSSTYSGTLTYWKDAAATVPLLAPNIIGTSGTYYIRVATSPVCYAIMPVTVTINANPVLAITNPSPVCSPKTVDITAAAVTAGSTSGLTYTYFSNAGATTTLPNPNALTNSGTYYIKGSAPTGCSAVAPASITINALPAAAISYPGGPYCAMGTAVVTQTGQAGGTYSSTAGLVVNGSTGAINLAASTAGLYTVTYSFSNGTCSNTTTTAVTINALPTATIAYPGSPYCATGVATVTQTGQAGGTYASTAGLVINASTGVIDLVTSTAGTYTVTYSLSNGTCSNTTTTSVTINALPTATIGYAGSPYCATGTAVVTQTGQAGGTYSSTAGLVINASTGAIDLVASTAGTYTVTYSYTDGVCANSTTSNLTIVALPVASISYPNNPYCTTGAAAVVRTGVSGGVFSSTTGLSINSNTGTIDLAASSPGTYTVTYSFASGACSNTSTTSILVRNPALLLTNPPAACAPSTVDLTAPAVTAGSDAGLSYTYFTDPGGTNPLNQPDAVGTSSTYYIRGTNTATGCTSSLEPVLVRINTPPIVTLAGDTDVCKGSPDTLTANSPGSTIDWLMVGSGGTVVVYPMVSGAYYAVATNAVNCSDTAAITIGVRPFSVALTATPEPVVSGNTVTLSSSANFSYQVIAWEPAATFPDQTAYSQTFTVHDTATQFYVIAQSSQGCLDTAGYSVIVDPNLKDFFIPNAFTPNNDGKNEVFKVYGSSIREVEIRIYSQWGQLVFESHDPQGSWDGSMGGHPVPVGIYLYAIKVVFYNDHILSKKGTVSLIR